MTGQHPPISHYVLDELVDYVTKLYVHVLKLEERIKALEKKNDDNESYYQEQQEHN